MHLIFNFFLKNYDECDYAFRERAKYLLFLFILAAVVEPVLIVSEVIRTQSINSVTTLFLSISLSIMAFSLILLKRGNYFLAANIFFVILFAVVWSVIFFDPSVNLLERFDTFGFVLAVLSLTPLFLNNRPSLVFYFAANELILIAVTLSQMEALSIPQTTAVDFIIDSTIAMVIVGVAALLIMMINRRAQEKNLEFIERQRDENSKMVTIVNTVESVSEKLTKSVESMALDIGTFSEVSQNQASSVEQITATIEELTSNADGILSMSEGQNKSLKGVLDKLSILSGVVGRMEEETKKITGARETLNRESEKTRDTLKKIVVSVGTMTREIKEIEGVVAMISDISDQINLLSLNAAIEAARAGEAGRGFAVVADEVSKLAEQTTENVKSITGLMQKNISGLNSSNEQLQSFIHVLNTMIASIHELGVSIDTIVDNIREDTALNSDLVTSTSGVMLSAERVKNAICEQHTAIAEVLKSVTSINESTQSVADGALNLSETSSAVSATGRQLGEVLHFKTALK